MKVYSNPSSTELVEILKRPVFEKQGLESLVQDILDNVKTNGDQALKDYAAKFDGVELNDLLVSQVEFDEAASLVDDELKNAIAEAKANIEKFHSAQKNLGNICLKNFQKMGLM